MSFGSKKMSYLTPGKLKPTYDENHFFLTTCFATQLLQAVYFSINKETNNENVAQSS